MYVGRAAVSTQNSSIKYPTVICLDSSIIPRAIICESYSSQLEIFTELQPYKVLNTPCTLAEPLSTPKIHRSNIPLLYASIHLSYLGQSCAKVTAHNSKYSQSYNHAKFLILHVRWQSRCQHPKFIDQTSHCYMSGSIYHT